MTRHDLAVLMDLHEGPRRVLIVEDHVAWLDRLTDALRRMGHSVTGMQGIDAVVGPHALGTGPDHSPDFTVRLDEFDAAFLDHYFLSRHYNGAMLAGVLREQGVARVFGMSSDASANLAMRKAGAIGAMRKSDLMRLFEPA